MTQSVPLIYNDKPKLVFFYSAGFFAEISFEKLKKFPQFGGSSPWHVNAQEYRCKLNSEFSRKFNNKKNKSFNQESSWNIR